MMQYTPENPQTPPPLPPYNSGPFGGAYVEPPQKPKSRTGRTVLMVLLGIAAFCFLLVIGASFLFKIFMTELGGGDFNMSTPKKGKSIALLRIEGPIYDCAYVMKIIEEYRKSDQIKGVLVRIDSPGGSVAASEEIYRGLLSLREEGKTVVTSFGNVAASGGYYVACASDYIFSNAGTLTGSIGALMSITNLEKISEKVGIDEVVIKSGKFKDVPSPLRQLSEEERAFLQTVVNDSYHQFADAVFENREQAITQALERLETSATLQAEALGPVEVKSKTQTPREFLAQIADGRVMTGRQASIFGLVDEIGTQDDALEYLATQLNIEEPELYEYRPVQRLFDLLNADTQSMFRETLRVFKGTRLEYRMPY
ncbi:MAG TPA: signal peptide peptidase SppA [Candidatus Sumerlaeota bacterium]|nr:signal peptide peptidase SppA [Candidatus Sumerlaeota bacterium]HPS00992.1 signal peptide peptidase SppA [Candidatus Sumerlaeota bacterium]